MEKKIVYIAYLIIFFVVFNFLFGFTDRVRDWQLWNWYLVILLMVMSFLLFIKYKQTQRKAGLNERIKETDQYRLELNQFLLLSQFGQFDDNKFNQFLVKFFKLKGYESIEVALNREESGYDLMMWSAGEKILLKWFKNAPMMVSLYSGTLEEHFEEGVPVTLKDAREAFGVMKDFDIQADQLILLSTNKFDPEVIEFANRNELKLMNGEDFYYELEQLREPQHISSKIYAS